MRSVGDVELHGGDLRRAGADGRLQRPGCGAAGLRSGNRRPYFDHLRVLNVILDVVFIVFPHGRGGLRLRHGDRPGGVGACARDLLSEV